jgi:hypothetical protein
MARRKRVLGVLGKRFARYGLLLHPDKTRFVDFRSNRPDGTNHPETNGTSFTFLGFAHIWGKSRAGKNVVRQVTAKNRYARALAAECDDVRSSADGMGTAVAWPTLVPAQQAAIPVVGLLYGSAPNEFERTVLLGPFCQGLVEMGFI